MLPAVDGMNRAFLCPQGGDWCQASGRHSPCVWGRVNSLLPAPVSRASLDALSLLVCSLFSADPEGAGPCGCLSPGPAGQDLSLGPQALVKLLCAGGQADALPASLSPRTPLPALASPPGPLPPPFLLRSRGRSHSFKYHPYARPPKFLSSQDLASHIPSLARVSYVCPLACSHPHPCSLPPH